MRIWNDLLYLFFPRLCLLCRRPLVEGEEHICLHCAEDLPYTYYTDVHGNPVYRLFKERFPVEAVTAFPWAFSSADKPVRARQGVLAGVGAQP